jgi:hypothetical protein
MNRKLESIGVTICFIGVGIAILFMAGAWLLAIAGCMTSFFN